MGTRWLGVGLASVLAIITIVLAVTGQLALYINPDSAWFAVGMAVLLLIGAVASFALPLGAEADHGHDHGDGAHPEGDMSHEHAPAQRTHPVAAVVSVTGGVLATLIVGVSLVVPAATLSTELAASRVSAGVPLFGGTDVVTLASSGDTSEFGVGEWATVFATATNPAAFDGDPIVLTGFVSGADGGFDLSRFVITHCVIDAQAATLPVQWDGADAPEGAWVTVTGTVRSGSDGALTVVADGVDVIDEPEDPYEY
ncbi:TIGR03943 family protein [Microbacterium sediminicola]|uniref:TIGR03943 family protein n=1 Tax=Microbacterium sediminicola TaxID=415210 RepID=A0ABN2ID67_9MICO